MLEYENDFISINKKILTDHRMNASQAYFLMQLIRLADKEGVLNISIVELMNQLNMTNKKQVVDYIKVLTEYRYIEKSGTMQRKSLYKINRDMFYK